MIIKNNTARIITLRKFGTIRDLILIPGENKIDLPAKEIKGYFEGIKANEALLDSGELTVEKTASKKAAKKKAIEDIDDTEEKAGEE